jgi:hypothetical protein
MGYRPEIRFEIVRADDVVPIRGPASPSTSPTRSSGRVPRIRSDLEPRQRLLFGHEVIALSADSELT